MRKKIIEDSIGTVEIEDKNLISDSKLVISGKVEKISEIIESSESSSEENEPDRPTQGNEEEIETFLKKSTSTKLRKSLSSSTTNQITAPTVSISSSRRGFLMKRKPMIRFRTKKKENIFGSSRHKSESNKSK